MSKKIIIRRPQVKDLLSIEAIAQNYENNPLPSRFETAAVCENGTVFAFGATRSICEGLFYVTGNDRAKVIALKQMMGMAIDDARTLEFDSIYVFAENDEFADILVKHFGFKKLKTVPLMLDL